MTLKSRNRRWYHRWILEHYDPRDHLRIIKEAWQLSTVRNWLWKKGWLG